MIEHWHKAQSNYNPTVIASHFTMMVRQLSLHQCGQSFYNSEEVHEIAAAGLCKNVGGLDCVALTLIKVPRRS